MHDPMSVVFDIPNPFLRRYDWKDASWSDRPPFVTVWHVDPEILGHDDSCGRSYRWSRERPSDGNEYVNRLLERVWWINRKLPWRWHLWHWKIQVHPIQNLKRWLFSRCCKCGKGFSWGYAPMSNGWGGRGPGWFCGEEGIYHSDCDHPSDDKAKTAKTA